MDIRTLKNENNAIEYKKCSVDLPSSFWETYSSFANTNDGFIILGVEEQKNGGLNIIGIENVDKIIKDIFNIASNKQKVSRNVLNNDSVKVETIDGKNIIIVEVKELPADKKPLYLKNNPNFSYIRRHEGDYLATDEEVRSLMRNANDNIDNELLKNYTIDDLDIESIYIFKSLVQKRDANVDYMNMDNLSFLTRMGVFHTDRNNERKNLLTLGGLLFLGKYEAIISFIPSYHLDYFNKKGTTERWKDRVATGELTYPDLNILKYYLIVLEKLTATIEEPFALDDKLQRKSSAELSGALREALVNMLIHADYFDTNSASFVEVHDTYYIFSNPGAMKITKREFFIGGKSRPRNNILTTLFRLIGASERAGTGGPKIFDVVTKNKFRIPEMELSINKTVLKLWMAEIKDSYPELSENAQKLMKVFFDENNQLIEYTSKQLADKTGLSRYYLGLALNELEERLLILKSGQYKSTKYTRAITSIEMLDAFSKTYRKIEQMLAKESLKKSNNNEDIK